MIACLNLWSVSLFLLAAASELAVRAETDRDFSLPTGFSIERAVAPGKVRFPMFATFDDKGGLFVAESSGLDLYEELQKLTRRCRISLHRGLDQAGRFQSKSLFAEGLVFPMGLAWRNGKLYVADPPELITLADTNADGRADERRVLLTGFGHTDNGSLHGLTFGPDGWLYMTMGQPDGYRIARADGAVIEGKSGALLRCRPDGSELEVVCRGFENLVEVIFMPAGEIIGTDNWFTLPRDGVRDALVHLLPGGVYPLDAHASFERKQFFSGTYLPAVQTYPAVAHSGLMRHTGRAMPEQMAGDLLSAQFNTRKIVRHKLTRHGSSFQSSDEDFLTTSDPDFHPADVLEAPDGSILVIDTGSWYTHHCPTGKIREAPAEGGIYRVRYKGAVEEKPKEYFSAEDLRMRLVRKPGDAGSESLHQFLSHPAAHVRLAAAEAIATVGAKDAVPALVQAFTGELDPFLWHALTYALHKTATTEALSALIEHPSTAVHRAALVLLDQPTRAKLTASQTLAAVRSDDKELRQAALAALQRHPEWSQQAEAYVRELLAPSSVSQNRAALQLLLPSFVNSPEISEALSAAILDRSIDATTRGFLLELATQADNSARDWSKEIRQSLQSADFDFLKSGLRSVVGKYRPAFDSELSAIARDDAHPRGIRLEAMRLLRRGKGELDRESFAFLAASLVRTNSPMDRLAAIEMLSAAQLSGSELLSVIEFARNDSLIAPSSVVALAQRCKNPGTVADELISYLRVAVEAGWQMPDATLEWLAKRFSENENFQRLRKRVADSFQSQRERLREMELLLSGGDPNAGHQLFLTRLACASCHRVGKTGGWVGPDLTSIGAIRSGRDLIESLVVPSATFAQGYETYQVTLANGEVITGTRVRDAADKFVLRDASGAETRLSPDEMNRASRLGHSLMPEALLSGSTAQEIRDLLAYLQSLK